MSKPIERPGLKYFGKTTRDPFKYNGSGKYWKRHLKKHGQDVETKVIGYYTSLEECRTVASKFSIDNDIVNSNEWANLKLENGTDGGNNIIMTDEVRDKMSRYATIRNQRYWTPEKRSAVSGDANVSKRDDVRRKISEKNCMREEHYRTMASERMKGERNPMKDPKTSAKVVAKLKGIPLSDDRKRKISKSTSGEKHWGYGKPRSEETKAKIKETLRQKRCGNEK